MKKTPAEEIMEKKGHMKAELDKRTPHSNELWRKATKRLEIMLDGHSGLPKAK